MTRYYLLTFRTNTGQMVTIKLPHAKALPTPEELKEAMDKMIETGIIDVIEGELVSREKVQIVSTETSEYELD